MHPGLSNKDSAPLMPLWPDLDPGHEYDPWPVRFAWAVSLTELIGGILVGVGLLTRIGAMGLAGVMLGALWLTTFGPALQTGDTMLGFLPKHDPFGPEWMVPVLQVTLLCAALSLLFAGPGTMSLDRLLLGGPPKPAPPKPAPPPAPAKK
ncbi:MAG: DoxX family protein [Phycisphaerales bacterium]|nr:DoxX family protein [Phycisphaerales bacterium]